jgi:hypothetical protein
MTRISRIKQKTFGALLFLVDECIADAGFPEFKRFLAKTQSREEFKNDLYDLTTNDAKIANKTKNSRNGRQISEMHTDRLISPLRTPR